ncbi:MAG: CAP domain-containing protein [Gaiella sp.]
MAKKAVLLLIVAAALAATVGFAPAAGAGAAAITSSERSIVKEINRARTARGLRALRISPALSASADAHTDAMLTQGFFAHESADGTPFDKRIRSFYGQGNKRWAVGENLLMSSEPLDAAAAVQAWLDSASHRKILLSPVWREVGIGANGASSVPGDFGGSSAWFATADFGAR